MAYNVEHIDANETVSYQPLKITHVTSLRGRSHDDSNWKLHVRHQPLRQFPQNFAAKRIVNSKWATRQQVSSWLIVRKTDSLGRLCWCGKICLIIQSCRVLQNSPRCDSKRIKKHSYKSRFCDWRCQFFGEWSTKNQIKITPNCVGETVLFIRSYWHRGENKLCLIKTQKQPNGDMWLVSFVKG